MRLSETTCRIGFEQLGDVPFGSWTDMVRVVPDLLRLGGYRSVYSLVSRFIKDARLRMVFSFHPLLIGGNPFTASAIYTLIPYLERRWGVHFAMGGTGQVDHRPRRTDRKPGRHTALQHQVEQIIVRSGQARGVRLIGGETIPADIVVSNADSAWTFEIWWRPASGAAGAFANWTAPGTRWACFLWYFGTNRRYDDVPTTPSPSDRVTANC